MEENIAKSRMGENIPIRERLASTNMGSGYNAAPMSNDLVKRELKELRQDINIVAQHIVAIRNEMGEKLQSISETSDVFEEATKTVFESIIKKISDGELDTFSEALNQLIKDDSESNRKKLFEDIERAIIAHTPKKQSSSISLMQWFINILLVGGIVATFFLLKG